MRLLAAATAFTPATVIALSIGSLGSSLQARESLSIDESLKSLGGLGRLNGTGCLMPPDKISEQKRANLEQSCISHQGQVDTALSQCAERARVAERAARDGSPLFQQYFRASDANTRNRVAEAFARIAAGCGNDGGQPISVRCTPHEPCFLPQNGEEELGATAMLRPDGSGWIRLCRKAFLPGQVMGCGETVSDFGDLMLHEMSHATVGTIDVAYGKSKSLNLASEACIRNADNYALFARDIANNCQGTAPGNGIDTNSPNGPQGDNNPPPGSLPGSNNNAPDFPNPGNQLPNSFPGSNSNTPPVIQSPNDITGPGFPGPGFPGPGSPGPSNGRPQDFPNPGNQLPNGLPGSNSNTPPAIQGPNDITGPGFPGPGSPGPSNGRPQGFAGFSNGSPNRPLQGQQIP